MAKTDKKTFSQRDISEAINNAVIYAKSPTRTGTITPARLARLYEYTKAYFDPLWAEIDEEILAPEEVVLICLAGGLVTQMKYITKSTQLPAVSEIKPMLLGEE